MRGQENGWQAAAEPQSPPGKVVGGKGIPLKKLRVGSKGGETRGTGWVGLHSRISRIRLKGVWNVGAMDRAFFFFFLRGRVLEYTVGLRGWSSGTKSCKFPIIRHRLRTTVQSHGEEGRWSRSSEPSPAWVEHRVAGWRARQGNCEGSK